MHLYVVQIPSLVANVYASPSAVYFSVLQLERNITPVPWQQDIFWFTVTVPNWLEVGTTAIHILLVAEGWQWEINKLCDRQKVQYCSWLLHMCVLGLWGHKVCGTFWCKWQISVEVLCRKWNSIFEIWRRKHSLRDQNWLIGKLSGWQMFHWTSFLLKWHDLIPFEFSYGCQLVLMPWDVYWNISNPNEVGKSKACCGTKWIKVWKCFTGKWLILNNWLKKLNGSSVTLSHMTYMLHYIF